MKVTLKRRLICTRMMYCSCDDKDDTTEIRVVAEVHEQCEENHVEVLKCSVCDNFPDIGDKHSNLM